MSAEALQLPAIILSVLAIVFCLYLILLEGFRIRHQLHPIHPLKVKGLPKRLSQHLNRQILAYLLGIAFFALYLFGQASAPLRENALFFVVYWWLTFTLALALFIFPARSLIDVLKAELDNNDRKLKDELSKQFLLFFLAHAESEKAKSQGGESLFGRQRASSDSDPDKPPTIH